MRTKFLSRFIRYQLFRFQPGGRAGSCEGIKSFMFPCVTSLLEGNTLFNEPLCGRVVTIIKISGNVICELGIQQCSNDSPGNRFQTDFDLLSTLSRHIARNERVRGLVVPNGVAQRMIMKNLSIVVGASEAIEQMIIILEAHEAEEKNKPFL
jgi:hypothetical protein